MRIRKKELALIGLLCSGVLVVSCSPQVSEQRRTVVPSAPAERASPALTGQPTASATAATDVDAVDCGGDALTLNGSNSEFKLIGDCPSVTIGGSDNSVDVTGATVASMEINGDRNSLHTASVSSIDINGQGSSVVADTVGSLNINGNENLATVSGVLESITISGNANVIKSGSDPLQDVSGSDNVVSRG